MRTILVMRHAKSDWGDPALADHDRPLAPRGERDAPRIGAALAALGSVPDRVVASSARRARETAQHAAAVTGYTGAVIVEGAAYAASGAALLALIARHADRCETLLLVDHNPGVEDLLGLLIFGAESGAAIRMPTAAVARVALASAARGTLEWLLTPRAVAALTRAKDP